MGDGSEGCTNRVLSTEMWARINFDEIPRALIVPAFDAGEVQRLDAPRPPPAPSFEVDPDELDLPEDLSTAALESREQFEDAVIFAPPLRENYEEQIDGGHETAFRRDVARYREYQLALDAYIDALRARFPDDDALAPSAYFWLADYSARLAQHFAEAGFWVYRGEPLELGKVLVAGLPTADRARARIIRTYFEPLRELICNAPRTRREGPYR